MPDSLQSASDFNLPGGEYKRHRSIALGPTIFPILKKTIVAGTEKEIAANFTKSLMDQLTVSIKNKGFIRKYISFGDSVAILFVG